jgi:hypothetical protein
MTGNRRELGGSFAFGPWHVRRAKYGARYSSPVTGSSGREPKSLERSYVCAL